MNYEERRRVFRNVAVATASLFTFDPARETHRDDEKAARRRSSRASNIMSSVKENRALVRLALESGLPI